MLCPIGTLTFSKLTLRNSKFCFFDIWLVAANELLAIFTLYDPDSLQLLFEIQHVAF